MLDVSGWMTNCHGSSASAVLDCAGAALEKPVFGRLNYTALGEGPVTNARNARTIDGRTRVPYDMHACNVCRRLRRGQRLQPHAHTYTHAHRHTHTYVCMYVCMYICICYI